MTESSIILNNTLCITNNSTGTPSTGIFGSSGTKIVLSTGSSTNSPYAIGIGTNDLWHGVPSGTSYTFYGGQSGTQELMTLSSIGNLNARTIGNYEVWTMKPNFQYSGPWVNRGVQLEKVISVGPTMLTQSTDAPWYPVQVSQTGTYRITITTGGSTCADTYPEGGGIWFGITATSGHDPTDYPFASSGQCQGNCTTSTVSFAGSQIFYFKCRFSTSFTFGEPMARKQQITIEKLSDAIIPSILIP